MLEFVPNSCAFSFRLLAWSLRLVGLSPSVVGNNAYTTKRGSNASAERSERQNSLQVRFSRQPSSQFVNRSVRPDCGRPQYPDGWRLVESRGGNPSLFCRRATGNFPINQPEQERSATRINQFQASGRLAARTLSNRQSGKYRRLHQAHILRIRSPSQLGRLPTG